MKKPYCLLLLLLALPLPGQSQHETGNAVRQHAFRRGEWLGGMGITWFGFNARAGYFPTDKVWLGVEAERMNLFMIRTRDVSLAGRYYFRRGVMNLFTQASASYGHHRITNFDLEGPLIVYHDKDGLRYDAGLGMGFHFDRPMGFEIVVRTGKPHDFNYLMPSLQFNITYQFNPKHRVVQERYR